MDFVKEILRCVFDKSTKDTNLRVAPYGVLKRESSKSTKESVARKLLKQRIGEMASDTFIEPKERRTTVEDLLDALEADYLQVRFIYVRN